MGNISSADEQGPLVVREWNPELRSERARELDRCHPLGAKRPPMRLGESFSIKQEAEEREKAKPQGTKITGMRFRTEARKLERLAAVEAWNLAKQEPTQMGKMYAQWRHAMHAARRRALLRVLVLVRFRLTLHRARPKLMGLGSLIPLALRERLRPVVEAQQAYLALVQELKEAKEAVAILSKRFNVMPPPPTPSTGGLMGRVAAQSAQLNASRPSTSHGVLTGGAGAPGAQAARRPSGPHPASASPSRPSTMQSSRASMPGTPQERPRFSRLSTGGGTLAELLQDDPFGGFEFNLGTSHAKTGPFASLGSPVKDPTLAPKPQLNTGSRALKPTAMKPTGRGVPPSSPLLRLFHEKERQDEAQQRPSTAPLGQQARGLGPPPLAKEQSAPELHPHPPALARSLSTRPSMKPRQGTEPTQPAADNPDSPKAVLPNQRQLSFADIQKMRDSAAKLEALQELVEAMAQRLVLAHAALEEHIDRCNSEWANRYTWNAPKVDDAPSKPDWINEDIYKIYAPMVVKHLKAGSIALQLFADEDKMEMKDGSTPDLWCMDPWMVLGESQPAMVASSISGGAPQPRGGLSLGTRILLQAILAVERATQQAEATEKLTIILHVSEVQRDQVLADIQDHQLYVRIRHHLLVVVHRSHKGFKYNEEEQKWLEEQTSLKASVGTGYSMLQLSYDDEALAVTDEGEWQVQASPVLKLLKERGVEWMLSWRTSDTGLLQATGPIDLPMMAYTMWAHSSKKVNSMVQSIKCYQWPTGPEYQSILLAPNYPPSRREKVLSMLEGGTPAYDLVTRVTELVTSELNSEHMEAALAAAKYQFFNQVLLPCHRYFFHVPSLESTILCTNGFRPKLQAQDGLLRVKMCVSDLTAHHRSRMVALIAREPPKFVNALADAPRWMPSLHMQDLALEGVDKQQAALDAQGQRFKPVTIQRQVVHRIVVMVQANALAPTVVRAACLVARPGVDTVVLLAVVPNAHTQAAAAASMEELAAPVAALGIAHECHAVVNPQCESITVLVEVVVGLDASLVVMGSMGITSAGTQASFTTTFLVRVALPAIVVTRHTQIPVFTEQAPLPRVLVLVEAHSRPLMYFISALVTPMQRAGRVFMAQIAMGNKASVALASSLRTLLAKFQDIATKHSLDSSQAVPLPLDPPFAKALIGATRSHELTLLALQLAPTTHHGHDHATAGADGNMQHELPATLMSVLCTSTVPVLVYPNRFVGLDESGKTTVMVPLKKTVW